MIYVANNKQYMEEMEKKFGGSNLILDKETIHLFRYKVKDSEDIVYVNKKFFGNNWEGVRA